MFQTRSLSNKTYNTPYLLLATQFPKNSHKSDQLPFRMTPIPNQLFLVDLKSGEPDETWGKVMLAGFDRHARRRIKRANEHPLEFYEATSEEEIQKGYELFLENAKTQGYTMRSWEDFGHIICKQIKKHEARFFNVKIDDKIICSHYGIIAGHRYFYTLGGTRRTDIDYSVGHFMHWNVMRVARQMKLEAYDFGSSATPGVLRFKKNFKPNQINFDIPHYYVLIPWKYSVMSHIFPLLKKI